jgi:hypothetical protein
MLNLGYWLRHPHQLPARIAYWAWERRNPDKPWLCAGTVAFFERTLRPDMRALEFGSGRSTTWFAQRVGHLTSIEHDPDWHARVRQLLFHAGIQNVDYQLIAAEHDQEPAVYQSLPRYVAALHEFPDNSLDLVIVDGHYRTACIREALPKLKPGGMILVDDCNMWLARRDIPVPMAWQQVDESRNGLKWAGVWAKP